MRATAGLMLLPHGIPKVFSRASRHSRPRSLARRGIEPALPLAYVVAFLETIGGVVHRARPVHALLRRGGRDRDGGHHLVYLPQGFGWTNRGYEYALMWGLIMFAIALRGGGPYSLDRRIGKEL